jgi:hypothetical protein
VGHRREFHDGLSPGVSLDHGSPSNSTALNVRVVGGASSAADFPVQISGNSTVIQGTSPWTIAGNSTVVILSGNSSVIVTSGNSSVIVTSGNSSVIVTSGNLTSTCIQGTNPWTIAGNSTVVFAQGHLASAAPSSGSSGLVVRDIYDLRLTVASSNAFASTSFAVQTSAAAIATYVTAYTITSTVAAATKIGFYDGATLLWPVQLQAVSSGVSGANLSGFPYLFKGSAAAGMTLQTPSSVAGVRVGVSYYRAP